MVFSSASGPAIARTSFTAARSRSLPGSRPHSASSSWSAAGGPRPSACNRSVVAGAGRSCRRGVSSRSIVCAEAVGRLSPCSTLQLPPPSSRAERRSASTVLPCRVGAARKRSTRSSTARSSWVRRFLPAARLTRPDPHGERGGAAAHPHHGRGGARAGRAIRSGRRPCRRRARRACRGCRVPGV